MRGWVILGLLGSWASAAAALDLVPAGVLPSAGPVSFDSPASVAFAADGSLWVADNGRGRVLHCTRSGDYLGEVSPRPVQWRPTGVAVLADGRVAVAAGDVTLHDADGSNMTALGLAGDCFGITSDQAGGFWVTQAALSSVRHWPSGVAITQVGSTGVTLASNSAGYVTSAPSSRIMRVPGIGGFPALYPIWIPNPFATPLDIEARGDVLLVADTWHHRLVVLDQELRILESFGAFGSGPGQFSRPAGLAVFPDGTLAVAELDNRRVSFFAEGTTPAHTSSWGRIKSLFR